ncbi:MAG: SpoIVB peptidase [Clostridia bacterium]|nr:SpoIVB peptidase [Clostridia bacterium]
MKKKLVLYFIMTVMIASVFNIGVNTFKDDVTVAEAVYAPKKVVPGGQIVGIKLFCEGILIVDITEIKTENGLISPGKEAGLKKGDYIVSVNGEKLNSISDFSEKIENKKTVSLGIVREGKSFSVNLNPYISQTHKTTRAGLWVRDSTAGIGTLTFCDTENKKFAALGHPINDVDTNVPFTISFAECFFADNFQITKASHGKTGEITGTFGGNGKTVGSIKTNTNNGISGKLTADISQTPINVANVHEITEGNASLLSNIEGGAVKSYSIKIVKVIRGGENSIKGFVIKITDKTLLNLTGGIIQGMSGSPVIQNGKLVGAVTHVFVNDPTRGYGIFIENMLAEAEKIK